MILADLEIPGVPQPKGSLRSRMHHDERGRLKVSLVHDNPKTKEWQHRIAYFVKASLPNHVPVLGAYRLCGTFRFERPESHLQLAKDETTGLRALRKGFGKEHTLKPDLDKLVRTVFDALKMIIYVDDSQVAGVAFTKVWTQQGSGVWLRIEELS